jgi:hypothetical protein
MMTRSSSVCACTARFAKGSNQEDPDENYLAKFYITFAPYANVLEYCNVNY